MSRKHVVDRRWRDLETRVATLFRDLGCASEIEVEVRGARAVHVIDVWVTIDLFGQPVRWAIECKRWKRPVTKAAVGALIAVVADVGADRGILVSESGFYPSAKAVASRTNILLTSPDELVDGARDALRSRKYDAIDQQILNLLDTHEAFTQTEGELPGKLTMRVRPGVEMSGFMRIFGELSVLESGLRSARAGRFPAIVGFDQAGERIEAAKDADEFIARASDFCRKAQDWINSSKSKMLGS
jgi:hypothetical protein